MDISFDTPDSTTEEKGESDNDIQNFDVDLDTPNNEETTETTDSEE
jgi:hypothetical protein